METITFTLPEPMVCKLKERAREANISVDELVRASVEEWLQRPSEDFTLAADYVLRKNAELYRRLA